MMICTIDEGAIKLLYLTRKDVFLKIVSNAQNSTAHCVYIHHTVTISTVAHNKQLQFAVVVVALFGNFGNSLFSVQTRTKT